MHREAENGAVIKIIGQGASAKSGKLALVGSLWGFWRLELRKGEFAFILMATIPAAWIWSLILCCWTFSHALKRRPVIC